MSHPFRLVPTVRPARAAGAVRAGRPAIPVTRALGRWVSLCASLAWLGACSSGPAAAPGAGQIAAAPASVAPASRFHNPAPRPGPGGSTYGAKHGGLVLSENGVQVELDAQPDQIDLYLEKDGKPLDISGAKGHVTLLNGVDITDAYLDPSADKQRLTIRGSYKLMHGTRVIARVNLPGQPQLNLRYLIVMLPPKPATAPASAAPATPAASR
ncbi:MAG: hypothetical protein RL722_1613 [Pseudomonadota bacterium]|jgi:hypothetical protein